MKNSNIEWTDHTFNPWIGCTKVSPGCANCYAEARDQRFSGGAHWGPGAPRQRTSAANWKQVDRWDRENRKAKCSCGFQTENWTKCVPGNKHVAECPECGHVGLTIVRPRVFCASIADWLDDEVPKQWRYDLLDLIQRTTNLDWLLLTKRPENWGRLLRDSMNQVSDRADEWICDWLNGKAPSNIWIGTTVEDQERADQRIPAMLSIPARIRFLSCEPLIGAVKLECMPINPDDPLMRYWPLTGHLLQDGMDEPVSYPSNERIDWVIAGGESGCNARPMHPDWARSVRDQCASAGVPFLFKQWGEWTQRCLLTIDGKPYGGSQDFGRLDPMCKKWPWSIRMCDCGGDRRTDAGPLPACVCEDGSDLYVQKVGKKEAGRILDGVEHNGVPEGGAA